MSVAPACSSGPKKSLVVVLRAVEHQVLEQMGEAGTARVLVLEPTWYQTFTATIGAL